MIVEYMKYKCFYFYLLYQFKYYGIFYRKLNTTEGKFDVIS